MKTTKLYILFMLTFAFTLFIAGCEKDKTQSPVESVVEDDILTSDLFDDIFAEVEDAMEFMEDGLYGGFKKSTEAVTCKTVTIEHPDDSTFWPRTVTIDYGEGCTAPNGRTRKGKIIIVVNGKFTNENYYRTVTFDNYYVDDFKIEGQKTVANEGLNDNGNMYFSIVLTGGKVISPEGKEMTKEYTHYREWIAGSNTPRLRLDDEYLITGTSEGINRKGISYKKTILEPLYVTKDCRWIRSGSIEIVAEGKDDAILDYGDGVCDRIATVTVGEETRTITLHK